MIHSPKKKGTGGAPRYETNWTLDLVRDRIEWEVVQSKGSARYCAWRLGVSPAVLSRVRSGHIRPSPKLLAAMGWEVVLYYRPKKSPMTPFRENTGRIRGDYYDKLKQQPAVMTDGSAVQENPLSTNGDEHGSDQQEWDLLSGDAGSADEEAEAD